MTRLLLPPSPRCAPAPAAAVTATGIIWSRYATQIAPVNYNLLAVNTVMACTGIWHLSRIVKHNLDQRSATPVATQ